MAFDSSSSSRYISNSTFMNSIEVCDNITSSM
jgi:hypothetical protein